MSNTQTHTRSAIIPDSHTWRTIANTAAHVVPHIKPDMHILDIGCGMGAMTVDFAPYVPQGHVTGVDMNSIPLEKGRAYAVERGLEGRVTFIESDATSLPFPDNTFDITHVHQVLQHATDPVQVLREMLRVTKPGGIVAARETDLATAVWYPDDIQGLDEWKDIYTRVGRARGGKPHAGRRVHVWAREAGIDPARITCTAGTWCFASPDERAFWSELCSSQFAFPAIAGVAAENGIASTDEIQRIVDAWKEWESRDDAWSILSGVIVAVK